VARQKRQRQKGESASIDDSSGTGSVEGIQSAGTSSSDPLDRHEIEEGSRRSSLESTNEQEQTLFHAQYLFADNPSGELEVSIQPPLLDHHDGEEKKYDTDETVDATRTLEAHSAIALSVDALAAQEIMGTQSSLSISQKLSMSPNTTMNARAEEILLEAQKASSQFSSTASDRMSDPQIRELIDQAMDKAVQRSRQAVAVCLSPTQQYDGTRTAQRPTPEYTPIMRSTKEVLEMASNALNREKQVTKDLDFSSPSPRRTSSSPYREHRMYSPVESDIGSIDDYEKQVERLTSHLEESAKLPREQILERIDGIAASPTISRVSSAVASRMSALQPSVSTDENLTAAPVRRVVVQEVWAHPTRKETSQYTGFSLLNYFWGSNDGTSQSGEGDSLAPMSCGPRRTRLDSELPAMATSLVRVMSDALPPSYPEAVNAKDVDPRMPEWMENQFAAQAELPSDAAYHLGDSRSVIVHEIQRGHWTWCTAWSPDGKRLAVATENHHLAVVDTSSSAVWRVRHDKKISGPVKNDTTHTIRSIAWGPQFIAIGGTGNAVSILAPTEPYPILHTIKQTGFIGSLHWLTGKNTLVIGSRLGTATIVQVWARDDESAPASPGHIQSTIVHTIDRQRAWVNAVKFSPGGTALAVGDSKGILGIYSYEELPGQPVQVKNVANFKLEDSILAVDWSPDGKWLYAGGEDFAVTVINTQWWEAIHRIKRDRWVQFISVSASGSHVAVGGVSSEVSILEVDKGWDTVLNVGLKGLVPLSAQWHPKDQYLVLTGQNSSILAVETTNARYVTGHFLRSVSPILAIEFSPDGRMAAIGNEAGVVTIFKLSGTTFITCYELVLDCDGTLSIKWSLNGAFLTIVTGNKLIIVARTKSKLMPSTAPPNASGFSVAKVIRDLGKVHAVAIHHQSKFIAVCGKKTSILDAKSGFKCIRDWATKEGEGKTYACSWSPDGSWLAAVGCNQPFTVYDTSSERIEDWRVVFTVEQAEAGLALAWGPMVVGGLLYCAFGGEGKEITIMEIRSKERTWEIVLSVPRDGIIHDLDWNSEGLLAAAVSNGTVTVMDSSYLQSGWAVNEMDYNWQRQALTCFTEIRRNRGKNSMRTVRWIPSAPGSDTLLAVGGTDGELEIVDLTERQRCSGFNKVTASI
jgi:WD40 repeat protein